MLAGCTSVTHYDYSHLPTGYGWRAVYDATENAVVFYGHDPLTGDTVYVGPDGQFYSYHHPGPIERGDLRLPWKPHDVP